MNHFANNAHYGSTSISCSSKPCRRYTALIAGSIVGAGFGIILILICIFHCIRRYRNRPSQSNTTFIHEMNLFKSGIWSSRYLRYGIWQGPYSITLSFDSHLFEVTGSGSDDLGTFTITGTYSPKTTRMALTKIYRMNYQIILQLIWNDQTRQFEGKRYLQCKISREENRFELKFNRLSRHSSTERF